MSYHAEPRPPVTDRGLWLAHHIRMTHRDQPCQDGCLICAEEAAKVARLDDRRHRADLDN